MRALPLSCLLLCLAGVAGAQQSPVAAPPARPASQSTAPTSPVTRAIQGARTDEASRAQPAALPQVAVPLTRKTPHAVAVKPGRAAPTRGEIDESAARCRASASAPADCARGAATAPR